MDNNLFSDLENLGFKDTNQLNIYQNSESKAADTVKPEEKAVDEDSLLYDRTVTCPVCGSVFKARSVKNSSYRIEEKQSDYFIRYSIVNPYFYDVWLCNDCGYAAMKSEFDKIKEFQKDSVKTNISSKWHGKDYGQIYDLDIAIERYKLSLLNFTVINAPASKKAMNCLKIAWMYRIKGDAEKEMTFLKNALEGFNTAFSNERCPIFGMDLHTLTYLIGELNRRVGNYEEALLWFSKVITAIGVDQKLKEKARTQKDLIKEARLLEENDITIEEIEAKQEEPKKKGGFFSKFK